MPSANPKVTPIAINAQGGLMTNIALTIMASKAVVVEDPTTNNGVQQGLDGYLIDTEPGKYPIPAILAPGVVPPAAQPQALQRWLPNNNGQQGPTFEPIVFGGIDGRVHGGEGGYVGGGPATVILQLTTSTPNAGGVLLYEWS